MSDVDLNQGLVLSALGITGALFGFATSQFVYYIQNYWRHDRLLLRIVVPLVWGLDLFHLVLYAYTIFQVIVFARSNTASGLVLPWTGNAQILVNACLVAAVQVFYLHRIWGLSRQLILVIVLGIVSAANLGLGITLMAQTLIIVSVAGLPTLSKFDVALSSVTAASDIFITITLVVLLLMSRRKGSRNNRLINRLMFYPINTGFLTSLCAILSLIMITTKKGTNFYVFFYYIGTRLYTICMIASLNARESLRNDMADAAGIHSIPAIRTHPQHTTSRLAGLRKYSFFATQPSSRSGSESHSGDAPAVLGAQPAPGGKARGLGEGHSADDLRRVHAFSLLPKS
ncbi:hypothetical protein BD309DRAFT_1014044 [Dichomitus squalens]|uniref:Uncharacterized protein n=1 Tax=Dichomitus squalens TaxID=114155 RepID=A0A4Q9Q7J9_9APHY|nr:uncharacterized protein DICSQDRAFT_166903 [Dichomitus squalens LYAD-421 SS1]EJF64744.1 hypothetical protein DICSQDRAFT_166903 [Dichomitus squalens LYAD-421 SS1]TBU50415.1 hypothetical protein BD309DRAFT_1014044 [Dichomitus squalens]TBU62951.1 hypothetical protein BD310DRAFT_973935 [Dichomitus squalens]